MGYRLEVSKIEYIGCGGKLYGYVKDETKLKSYQWLLEHEKITGYEDWEYGCNPKIILDSKEFKEFITLYIEEKIVNDTFIDTKSICDSLLELSETDFDKLLEWY